MATTPQVAVLLDDAALAQLDAERAITEQARLGRQLMQMGARIARAARDGITALELQDRALRRIRRLRPTARGRRTDITERKEAA